MGSPLAWGLTWWLRPLTVNNWHDVLFYFKKINQNELRDRKVTRDWRNILEEILYNCHPSKLKLTLNPLASFRERTIVTEWPPLFGEVSANLCGNKVSRSQHDWSLLLYLRLSRPEPLLFLPSSSSVVLTRLSGLRSRPTTSQKTGTAGNRTRTSLSVARNSGH
jgi:hypothetical protein